MIVYKCDQCGDEITDPDNAPTQEEKIFCSNACRARFTLQSEPVAEPSGRSLPPPNKDDQALRPTFDEAPSRSKKIKSALALWIPIFITGLIVTAFYLPKYFLKKNLDATMDELRASGNLDELLVLDPGQPPANQYTDPTLGFTIAFPEGWTVKDALTDASIAKKAVYKDSEDRRATIIVYAWEISPEIDWLALTPRSLFEQSYGQTAEYLDGREATIDGHRALWIKFRFTDYPMESYAITCAVLKDNILFSIFGQTLFGDYAWFQEYEDILVNSIDSFEFL